MHYSEFRTAFALSRLRGNEVACAIILAIANVISFAFVRRDDHARSDEQEQHTYDCNQPLFHTRTSQILIDNTTPFSRFKIPALLPARRPILLGLGASAVQIS
jgi:hypothetical protein